MADFETHPVGTAERLDRLERYAKRASEVMAWSTGQRAKLSDVAIGLRLVDPSAFACIDGQRRRVRIPLRKKS